MDLGIAGKWALVCGASKGLGLGCAQALAREGVNVLIVARGAEVLEQAAASLRAEVAGVAGAKVLAVAADIVNITSSAVKAPIDILGLSNGARSGLTGFVAGVSRSALAAKGVTINNLLPGKFDTDRLKTTLGMLASKSGQSEDAIRQAQMAQIPARRFGNADEFGAICAFLCSQQASYINGQNMLADGGAYPGTY